MTIASSASGDLELILAVVHSALRSQNIDVAITEAEKGLAQGLADPLLFNLAAYRQQVAGRFDQALALLEQARQLAPTDVFILCSIGSCLSQQGLNRQALEIYDQALRINSRHAPAHHGLGLALNELDEVEAAYDEHVRAVELAPDYPDALAALAGHAVRRKDFKTAQTYAGRALTADPDEPSAIHTLAFLEEKRGDYASAEARLQRRLVKGGLAPLHVNAMEALLGVVLDRLDRPEEAFQAHVRSNAAAWALHQPLMAQAGVETGVNLCRRLNAYFADADPQTWRPAPSATAAEGEPDTHVFLIGFVRSGTTLLEQVLASHSRVIALEEKPLLRAIAPPYFKDEAGLKRLANLTAQDADALRADYWKRVRDFGVEPSGRVFVDKNPLDAIWLPLVAKLFPKAKILFSRRDPRDVVISSFRHQFKVNALTCAFTGLERTAEFYSEVMALDRLYQEKLPIETHSYRHEDLVDDFDREVKAICDFLGLEWTTAMRNFSETAKKRDIRTPSADQVRQGLSRDGLGRWRRFGPAVEPIMPIVEPWVRAFGYSA